MSIDYKSIKLNYEMMTLEELLDDLNNKVNGLAPTIELLESSIKHKKLRLKHALVAEIRNDLFLMHLIGEAVARNIDVSAGYFKTKSLIDVPSTIADLTDAGEHDLDKLPHEL